MIDFKLKQTQQLYQKQNYIAAAVTASITLSTFFLCMYFFIYIKTSKFIVNIILLQEIIRSFIYNLYLFNFIIYIF